MSDNNHKCETCGEQYPPEKMQDEDECKACTWGENRL